MPLGELAASAVSESGPLAHSRVNDLIEFGRIAHAEMAAICTAARRGNPLLGSDLYTTTFPCHECARLILAAGINKVLYIDPYPKSQVPAMYPHQIDVTGAATERSAAGPVPFVPFQGVAPKLFPEVFVMAGRERDPVTGSYLLWDPQTSVPRRVVAAGANAALTLEQSVVSAFLRRLETVGWRPGSAGPGSVS
jgi:cytidine deaminase